MPNFATMPRLALLLALMLALPAPAAAGPAPLETAPPPPAPGRGPAAAATVPAAPPWAAVGRLTVDRQFVCTATLIAPDVVLTAAHCVVDGDGRPYASWRLGFEAGVAGPEAVLRRQVSGARVHPAYETGMFASMESTGADVAMLDLTWPVGAQELAPIPVGGWTGHRGGLLLPSYGEGHEDRLRIERGCAVDEVEGPVLRLLCTPPKGASGAPLIAGRGAARRVVAVLSNSRGGFSPRGFAVRADIALAALAGPQ